VPGNPGITVSSPKFLGMKKPLQEWIPYLCCVFFSEFTV